MKTNTKYIILFLALLAISNFSCKDFLDEENRASSTEDVIYTTKAGIDGLVASSYSYLRGWYGKEAAFGLSEGGTDIWLTGYDNRQRVLIDYSGITPEVATSANKESMNACFDEYWEMLFSAVNLCNTGIKYVTAAPATVLSESERNTYIGELKALRAFYYWHLVETWGPVQINREPVTSISSEAHRNTEAEVYTFMLEDINDAIAKLAAKTVKTGRVNFWAAKAMKARFLIYKASKNNDAQAYAEAATVANEVIAGSGASFYPKYTDCWSGANEDGINNKEVLWYVDYSNTLEYNILPKRLKLDASAKQMTWAGMILRKSDNSIGGNASHLMFVGVWNSVPAVATVMKRTDTEANKALQYNYPDPNDPKKTKTVTFDLGTAYQAYSKGFTRFVPSGYLLDLYNDETDQRYQASFRDVYYLAPTIQTAFANGIPAPTGYAAMKDTAMYLSKKKVTNAQIARADGRYVLFSRTDVGNAKVFPLYQDAEGTLPTIATSTAGAANNKGNRMYIQLKKFDDLTGSVIRDLCSRDAFVIRLSEMYLIAAEGLMMSGNSGEAVLRLNDLRIARQISGKDNSLSSAEVAQVSAKNIDIILDERARELCGEQQRWFDLKRTGKLIERVKKYNGSAKNNIVEKHLLRPIPQPQIDAVENKADFLQNTGY